MTFIDADAVCIAAEQEAVCTECWEGVRQASTIFSKLAQLLSGHQLHAAAALAAASGNVRLATQIAQVRAYATIRRMR